MALLIDHSHLPQVIFSRTHHRGDLALLQEAQVL